MCGIRDERDRGLVPRILRTPMKGRMWSFNRCYHLFKAKRCDVVSLSNVS